MSKPPANIDLSARPRSILVCQIIAWSLSLVASLLSILAWGNDYDWRFTPFNSYQVFPLLGLLAFSLMWTHYASSLLRELLGVAKVKLAGYFEITGYAVLILICLHPGLLIYQLFRDGAGLPPSSYEHYVAPGLGWVTLLGTASLLVFLAYEFRRIYEQRPWWPYVVAAGDLAMLAIFYHGLRLGTQLQQDDWFQAVWWFYGLTLVAMITRKYANKYLVRTKKART